MNHTETAETLAAATASFFTAFDCSVFGALLFVSLAIGLYFGFYSGHEQMTEEYLLGGHNMQALPVAISLVASHLSSMSIMTLPVEMYSFGWQFALLLPGITVVTIVSNYLFIPVYYNNGIDNCYAYLELRFSKSIRNFKTAVFVVVTIINLPVLMFIPSLAFSEVTGQNLYVVNTIACVCCVIYTMLGGIKAVVWVDVVQGSVMFLSIVLVAFFGVQQVGGLSEVWDQAVAGGRISMPDISIDLTTRNTLWNVSLGMFIMWSCQIAFNQSCVQRLVSMPTLADSRRALTIFCFGFTILLFFNFSIGIVMYAYYSDCDPIKAQIVEKADKLVPRFVQDTAGHISGMPGLFVSCIFSASLSAVSAMMNALAGIIYSDYIKPVKIYRHTERKANLIMKGIVLTLGIVCIFGAFFVAKFSSLLELLLTISGAILGSHFGIFTLGMLYPWANHRGGMYGMLISIGVLCGLIVNTLVTGITYEPLPTSILGCTNGTIASDLFLNTIAAEPLLELDDSFAFHKISFMWYFPLGAAITWIAGIVISYFTGGQKIDETNITLLAPCVQRMLPRKYRHEPLALITAIPQPVKAP